MKRQLFVLVALVLSLSVKAGTKKFIGHSWDLHRLPPEVLAKNIDKLEALPLDGISINCKAKDPSGKAYSFNQAMTTPPWDKSWVDYLVPALKTINGGRLKHNFITAFQAPTRRVSWNDDQRWADTANNMGIVAWLAKTTGARGIMIDPEDYYHTKQYTYLPEIDKGTYAEVAALARRRGGQVMKAIAAEFPDASLIFFWLISVNPTLAEPGVDVAQTLEKSGNLWLPFVNGLLDEIPPEMRLVDGCENAYRYDFESYDFVRNALVMTRQFAGLVAPENRAKYYSQVQAGFGLYLDMYVNKKTHSYYFPPYKGSRLKRLHGNFKQAMFACDEFCWVYGEKFNWVKWDYPADFDVKKASFAGQMSDTETWNDVLPGVWRTMQLVRDPKAGAVMLFEELAAANKLVNLLPNADCMPALANDEKDKAAQQPDWDSKGLPKGWSSWEEKPTGKFSVDTQLKCGDANSVRLEGIKHGCAIVQTNVEPGGTYAVEAMARGKDPSMTICWQRNNKWSAAEYNMKEEFGAANADGWRLARAIITVPESANQCVLLLNGRLEKGETVNYAKPAIYKLELD